MPRAPLHSRRWASDGVPSAIASGSTSPSATSDLVELTIDLPTTPDTAAALRTVMPTPSPAFAPPSAGCSSASSSRRFSGGLRQFSHDLVHLLSHDLKAEIRKLSRAATSSSTDRGDSAIAARELRRLRARLDREWSEATTRAIRGLRFISTGGTRGGGAADAWREVSAEFDALAVDGLAGRSDFARCIGMKETEEFAWELFDALRRRKGISRERISKEELKDFWSLITDESFDSRLQIFFDMVDKNEDGRITEAEVEEIIMLSASANRLLRLKEQAEEYAALIMEELDPEQLGYIELWQLEAILLQKDTYVSYSQALSSASLQAVSQNLQQGLRGRGAPILKLGTGARCYVEDNWRRLWVLAVWVALMVGLFLWKFFQYRNRYVFQVMGYCVTTAKGAAETLKLNMAIILLPVCRNTITWLRGTRCASLFPFDDNINFHKTIAAAIVVGVILHAGNHLACDFPRLLASPDAEFSPMADDFGGGKPTYWDLVRGVEGITGILMVVFMLVAFVLATHWFRRNVVNLPRPFDRVAGFNAFWYSHHIFLLVYILLIVHGLCLYLVHDWYRKTTWMYLAFPMLLYAGERVLRAFRSGNYAVQILKVAIYPGNVLTVYMSNPPAFHYKSGQYIFVQCPDISPFEWHPFSVTSAPGDGYVSIHIRQLGDWTHELKRIFAEICEPPTADESGLLRVDVTTRERLPKLLIDGPYGAPAQDYSKYDVLMLIGLGIGATPFVSILKDLLNNIIKMEEQTGSTSDISQNILQSFLPMDPAHSTSNESLKRKQTMKTTNAYFYWVTREQGSFDWFKGIMNEIVEIDKRGIIEMHNYLTSVYEEGDARSALITMVQALLHAKNGVDIVSGTRVRTHFARPNWKKVFSKTCSKHPGARIGVFFCGTTLLAKELSKLCKDHNRSGSSTKLDFHKEHF